MSSAREVHSLRIHCKKLRYTLELFGPRSLYGIEKQCRKQLKQMQKRLGRINDHTVTASRLKLWKQLARGKSLHDALRRLEAAETKRAARATNRFLKWWRQVARDRFGKTLTAQFSALYEGVDEACPLPQTAADD